MKNGVSKVYTERPDYADFDSPAKFEAIKSIIAKRLIEHPDAICSYSGGSDSDIMLDLIERTRAMFELPPIKYVFFNTGLEMKATRDHVKYVAEKYYIEWSNVRTQGKCIYDMRRCGGIYLLYTINQIAESGSIEIVIPSDGTLYIGCGFNNNFSHGDIGIACFDGDYIKIRRR